MRTRTRRGFTLVEAVAAIVILAVAVPPMLWAIRSAHVQRVNPILASRARWAAVEKLEALIRDRHSSTRGYAYLLPGNYPPEDPVPSAAGFRRETQLTETGADLVTPGTGYMQARVVVSWTDGGGAPRSFAVETVLTEYVP
jgi:prepilin-type N-terminal cleavage/methylation domain-containing protein